jgi:hypothetical protein
MNNELLGNKADGLTRDRPGDKNTNYLAEFTILLSVRGLIQSLEL